MKKKIAELHTDPANARKHSKRNIDAIAASLARFGQQKPVVIDRSNVVRAGNGTLEAARLLGWTELDCVVTKLEGAEATAYAIADNRTSELAEWDDDVLAATLQGLEDAANGLGFDSSEIDALIGDTDVQAVDMPTLKSGDREPFQRLSFVVHDSQAELILEALAIAKGSGGAKSAVNDNSNGNALTWIAEKLLAER